MSVQFDGSREDFFPELMAWAQECGASCEGFEVSSFGGEGYGLRATRDIKVSSETKSDLWDFLPFPLSSNTMLSPRYGEGASNT